MFSNIFPEIWVLIYKCEKMWQTTDRRQTVI